MDFSNKTTTFKYDGSDFAKFHRQVIRLLYDVDIDEVVYLDGNMMNLTSVNIKINKCKYQN